jgi:hypothetical protein
MDWSILPGVSGTESHVPIHPNGDGDQIMSHTHATHHDASKAAEAWEAVKEHATPALITEVVLFALGLILIVWSLL